jgi:hypothetical protein
MKLYGRRNEKDGKTYAQFNQISVKFQPGKAKILIRNLFNEDPVLGQIGNELINDNQELLYDDLVPLIENEFAEICQKSANQIFGNATLDEIFPDI